MGSRIHLGLHHRARFPLFRFVVLLVFFSTAAILLFKVDEIASRIVTRTKTVAGHNLGPVPWHLFPPKEFNNEGSTYSKASKLFKCSYLACLGNTFGLNPRQNFFQNSNDQKCPAFYRWIHRDLEPWVETRISQSKLMEAQKSAAFRVVIVGGRLYVDLYYDCVQSRLMFTIWGLLQLLKKYPGMVPDVDLMFDCMDKPSVSRNVYKKGTDKWPPPPMFRYCTTKDHFDIPFPDWSFWGWSEINIGPWDEEFRNIQQGSQALNWTKRQPNAYWRGNPDVGSPIRSELLKCNDPKKWGAEIVRQNWVKEGQSGFKESKLANQCKHRYKIYAEGYAWSVSLKYILSCGSTSLIISPEYEDFFSRGLLPKENYWPVSYANLCSSIKSAVDWGNAHPSEAENIGKGGQGLMESISMERVYEYMYHLITEYSKLQDFKPVPPSTAQEICVESVLCLADPKQKQFLERSSTSPSLPHPCMLPHADHNLIEKWIQKKNKIINDVQKMEKMYTKKGKQ